jgi:hypothetical protein
MIDLKLTMTFEKVTAVQVKSSQRDITNAGYIASYKNIKLPQVKCVKRACEHSDLMDVNFS